MQLAALLAVLTVATAAPSYADPLVTQSLCPEISAEEWLAEHPDPIQTREDLLAVPRGLQRDVFATLPSEVKSDLWIDKVMQTIQSAGLNADQVSALQQLATVITPFVWDRDDEEMSEVALWYEEATPLFSTDELGQIGLSLEDYGAVTQDPTSTALCLATQRNCACSTQDDWCAFPAPHTIHCVATSTCTRVKNCGWFWSKTCDGFCTGLGPG